MVPGPLDRGLAVAARTGEDGVTVLTTLLGQVLQGCLTAHPVVFMGQPGAGGPLQATGADDGLAGTALYSFVAVSAFAPPVACDGLGSEHGHARARLLQRSGARPVAAHQGLVEPGPAPGRRRKQ